MSIDFRVSPERYRHWRVAIDAPVATLTLDVDEAGGLVPGYELKLNSYDLGVDIELYDAVQRLRFGHPEVRTVVVTSGKDKIFSAGANIRMLAASSHAWKVNFCKFTNETRNGIEDASANSGQTYLAALNGTASGGGYELALACEHIMLVDDRSSTVSLPELPLLGVLPGTGGLTRVVDKRHVRRDLADYFSTRSEGVGGAKAVTWRLVDEVVPRPAWSRDRGVPRRRARGPLDPAVCRDGCRAHAAREEADRRRDRLSLRVGGAGPRGRDRRDHGCGSGRGRAGVRRRPPARRCVLDPRDDARARRPDPRSADQRDRTRHLAVPHRGRPGAGARPRPAAAGQPVRLAGQRDPALPQADAETPRRHQPQHHRPRRAGQLLRRLAAGTAPGRRSLVPPAGRLRGRRRGRRARRDHGRGDQRRPAADGQRPVPAADPLLRRRPRPGRGASGDRRAARRRGR